MTKSIQKPAPFELIHDSNRIGEKPRVRLGVGRASMAGTVIKKAGLKKIVQKIRTGLVALVSQQLPADLLRVKYSSFISVVV